MNCRSEVVSVRLALLRALLFAVVLQTAAASRAQVLSPVLQQAMSVDAALAAIGAGKPEASTFMLLDLPEIAMAGKLRATMASELAGTSWLILLRGRAGRPASPAPGRTPQPVLLGAWPFKAGAPARATLNLDFDATESFTLLAYTRGRWFSVEREVKLGLPPEIARAAKEARARKLSEIAAKPADAQQRPAKAASAASAPAAASTPAVADRP